MSWKHRRVRDDVLVDDALGHASEESLEIELEGSPGPVEQRGMELAEPACLGLGRLARMEQRVRAARDPSSRWSASYSVSSTPLTTEYPPIDDTGDTPVLVRELLAGREVDPRDLEERDVIGAGVDAGTRRLDEAGHDGRPEDRLIRRHRVRAGECASGFGSVATRLHVYASESPAPTSVSSTTAPEALLLREPSADMTPQRHRERDAVEERCERPPR